MSRLNYYHSEERKLLRMSYSILNHSLKAKVSTKNIHLLLSQTNVFDDLHEIINKVITYNHKPLSEQLASVITTMQAIFETLEQYEHEKAKNLLIDMKNAIRTYFTLQLAKHEKTKEKNLT